MGKTREHWQGVLLAIVVCLATVYQYGCCANNNAEGVNRTRAKYPQPFELSGCEKWKEKVVQTKYRVVEVTVFKCEDGYLKVKYAYDHMLRTPGETSDDWRLVVDGAMMELVGRRVLFDSNTVLRSYNGPILTETFTVALASNSSVFVDMVKFLGGIVLFVLAACTMVVAVVKTVGFVERRRSGKKR